jgi:acyltransferase
VFALDTSADRPRMEPRMHRLTWPDHAKAFAMFLVVYGHSLATGWGIGKWIYSFHIPMFFLISGYLLKRERLEVAWRTFLSHTSKALIPPYLTFATIGFFAWLLVLRRFGADSDSSVSPFQRFVAILYASGKPDHFRVEPSALWFFPCLFSARLLVYWVYRAARLDVGRALGISAALSALGLAIPRQVALPLEAEAALVAQGFLVLGFELRRHDVLPKMHQRVPAAIPVLFVLGAAAAYLNVQVDMRASRYGSIVLYYASALCTSLACFLSVHELAPNRIASAVARDTTIIFPLHLLVFSAFAAFYVFVLRVPLAVRENAFVGIAASAFNVALLVAVSPLFRRFLPWVFGATEHERPHVSSLPAADAAEYAE